MGIRFTAPVTDIDGWAVVRLPAEASAALPSRGMCMVEGTLDGSPFQAPLEPDGAKGHWLHLDDTLRALAPGDEVALDVEPSTEWPEPTVPADVAAALAGDTAARAEWDDTTVLARWDWLRSINGTANPATRAKRITVMLSKLGDGKRRPCCFDRSTCTEPAVSKGGVLRPGSVVQRA